VVAVQLVTECCKIFDQLPSMGHTLEQLIVVQLLRLNALVHFEELRLQKVEVELVTLDDAPVLRIVLLVLFKFLNTLVHFFELVLTCLLLGCVLVLRFLVLKVLTVRKVLLKHLKLGLVILVRPLGLLRTELLH